MWGTPAFGAQTWGTADLTPVGVAATASIGAFNYFINNIYSLSGVGSTTSIGSLGFLYDGSAVLGSVIASAVVGSAVPHSDLDRALTDVAIAGDTGFITANSYKSYTVRIRLNSRI